MMFVDKNKHLYKIYIMGTKSKEYCGDKKLIEQLRGIGAEINIFQLYGLIYGSLAGTKLVMPSKFITRVLGDNSVFNSIEEANEVLTNLMSLWNRIAEWNLENETFIFPEREYPVSRAGFLQLLKDQNDFVEYFVKGLDLGETCEEDFTDDGFDALKSLAEASGFLMKFREIIEKDKKVKITQKDFELNKKLEAVMVDCFRRINIGLRDARTREAVRRSARGGVKMEGINEKGKIGRNEACPCGSGKKYKNCCGMVH